MKNITLLLTACYVAIAILATGCSKDPVAPTPQNGAVATTDQISVKMSSIDIITDCDPVGGAGDFYITIIVHKTFEDGTTAEIGRSPEFLMQANDGEIVGAPESLMSPITFTMPREPGAKFTVEAYINEYDGSGVYSMQQHTYTTHQFDRNDFDTWGPTNSDFISYSPIPDGRIVGVTRFAGWSNGGDCRGSARYAIYIEPIYE